MNLPPTRFGLGVTNCRPSTQVVSAVVRAEQLGAELAFISEDVNCRDAFALASVAAARTERIRIGTGVVNPYTRAPNSLAMGAATLDEISGGRAVLGLGSSSATLIRDQLGLEYGKPVGVMTETAAVLRRLFAGDTVTFCGEYIQLSGVRLAVTPIQDRLPIFWAAMGPGMLRLAGQVADGVLLNVGATPEYVRWAVDIILAGAREAERDVGEITIAAWLSVYLDDEDIALERARAWLASMLSIPRQGELLLEHAGVDLGILEPIRRTVSAYPHGGDAREAARYVPEAAARRMALVGSKEAVHARIQDYRDAGVQIPILGIQSLETLYAS